MKVGRVVLIVCGALVALGGLGAVAGGGTLVWAHETQRDAAGFYHTPTDLLVTPTYAFTASVDLGTNASQGDWVPVHPAGTVRIRASSATGRAVFIGVARTSDVNRWLAGVPHDHVTSIAFGPFTTQTRQVPGLRPPTAPSAQTFWVASASGAGRQTLIWPSRRGEWTLVAMNAGAGAGVALGVSVGVRTSVLLPIGIGFLVVGVVLLGLASLLLYLGLREPRRAPAGTPSSTEPAARPASPPVAAQPYPATLDGHLDPTTSRWLWLVKWILVIPHVVILVFLWLAVVVLTVIAGFAILFTGRYPRSIFEFNVGVMRWTWRVSFYAIGAFATDRYPPFSLAPDPTYPADFAVDYPEHLSRGLVLVKWWLLAIPQYVVVSFFAGGWSAGTTGGRWTATGGFGLIGVLAIISAVILGVRGRYPQATFDLLMGLNRWTYRVLAYAALLRDEYPPFRLDGGGADPANAARVASAVAAPPLE